jgi:hypothetical protein
MLIAKPISLEACAREELNKTSSPRGNTADKKR